MKKLLFLFSTFIVTASTPHQAPCKFNVTKIAGKTQAQIAKLYGDPSESSSVSPSRTPCPCTKMVYLGGTLEIVYMNGKADWITIHVDKNCKVFTGDYPMHRFNDYAYIKAFTK